MKKIILAALVLLTGCSNGDKDSPTVADSTIVLKCSGENFYSNKSEPGTYLIQINPNNLMQKSLYFYNWTEKRFVSPCFGRFNECQVSVNSDLITETGVMRGSNNEALILEETEINRRTGKMLTVRHEYVLDNKKTTTFKGECIKGSIPTEEPQKF